MGDCYEVDQPKKVMFEDDGITDASQQIVKCTGQTDHPTSTVEANQELLGDNATNSPVTLEEFKLLLKASTEEMLNRMRSFNPSVELMRRDSDASQLDNG